jgi:hypothetical protein
MDDLLKVSNEQRITIVIGDAERLELFRALMRRMYESLRPEIQRDPQFMLGLPANMVLQMANELLEI